MVRAANWQPYPQVDLHHSRTTSTVLNHMIDTTQKPTPSSVQPAKLSRPRLMIRVQAQVQSVYLPTECTKSPQITSQKANQKAEKKNERKNQPPPNRQGAAAKPRASPIYMYAPREYPSQSPSHLNHNIHPTSSNPLSILPLLPIIHTHTPPSNLIIVRI